MADNLRYNTVSGHSEARINECAGNGGIFANKVVDAEKSCLFVGTGGLAIFIINRAGGMAAGIIGDEE